MILTYYWEIGSFICLALVHIPSGYKNYVKSLLNVSPFLSFPCPLPSHPILCFTSPFPHSTTFSFLRSLPLQSTPNPPFSLPSSPLTLSSLSPPAFSFLSPLTLSFLSPLTLSFLFPHSSPHSHLLPLPVHAAPWESISGQSPVHPERVFHGERPGDADIGW